MKAPICLYIKMYLGWCGDTSKDPALGRAWSLAPVYIICRYYCRLLGGCAPIASTSEAPPLTQPEADDRVQSPFTSLSSFSDPAYDYMQQVWIGVALLNCFTASLLQNLLLPV